MSGIQMGISTDARTVPRSLVLSIDIIPKKRDAYTPSVPDTDSYILCFERRLLRSNLESPTMQF